MKRFFALTLMILLLIPFTGCDPLFFSIRFANSGISDNDIIEIYIAPDGGTYGDNVLPVDALHAGDYFVLEGLDRWSDYDVKVVFDAWDSENEKNFEYELLGNVPVSPPEDCVTWHAYYNVNNDSSTSYGLGYSWGCEDEFDYDLVGD